MPLNARTLQPSSLPRSKHKPIEGELLVGNPFSLPIKLMEIKQTRRLLFDLIELSDESMHRLAGWYDPRTRRGSSALGEAGRVRS